MKRLKTTTDYAYDYLKKIGREINFNDLANYVGSKLKISENKSPVKFLGSFFTDLTLDPRFLLIQDYNWDLAERYTFDETNKVFSRILVDDEEEEDRTIPKSLDVDFDLWAKKDNYDEDEDIDDDDETEDEDIDDDDEDIDDDDVIDDDSYEDEDIDDDDVIDDNSDFDEEDNNDD